MQYECPGQQPKFLKCSSVVQADGLSYKFKIGDSEENIDQNPEISLDDLRTSESCTTGACDIFDIFQSYTSYYRPYIQKRVGIADYEHIMRSSLYAKEVAANPTPGADDIEFKKRLIIREKEVLRFTCQGGFLEDQNFPQVYKGMDHINARCQKEGQNQKLLVIGDGNFDLKTLKCKKAQVAIKSGAVGEEFCKKNEVASLWPFEKHAQLRSCLDDNSNTLWVAYEMFGSSLGISQSHRTVTHKDDSQQQTGPDVDNGHFLYPTKTGMIWHSLYYKRGPSYVTETDPKSDVTTLGI